MVWYGRGLLPGGGGTEASRCARPLLANAEALPQATPGRVAGLPEEAADLAREAGE